MSVTLEQLLAGIRQVESGGRYSVVNSIGAVGAYQVMKANIPEWTKKALGHSLTWQQFRDSPSAQDKVAQVILGGYYKKYGAAGAASMWFSGQPNANSSRSDGGNTVSQYVAKVLAAAGAGGTGVGEGSVPVTPKLSDAELAAQYGLSSALINSSSELKALFKKAVAGGWSADRFTASLKNTKWWSTQPDSLRQYITLQYTDPATWKQKQDQAAYDLNALAVQVGLGNQIFQAGPNKGHANGLLQQAIYNSLALGWSDARIKDWFGARVATHGGMMWGDAGTAFDQIHSLGYLNGMKYTGWAVNEARNIAAGRSTIEEAEAHIRQEAAAKYSAFATQIKAGQNVMDLASPYIQSVAKILEVPDSTVDLFNSHVQKAMTSNKAGQAMSIWDFENSLRQDPAWKKTQNAQDNSMQVAHQVLTQFGMVF
ncbi:MAG: transglycosylase SLT domain-containing protein [Humibacter sp.]